MSKSVKKIVIIDYGSGNLQSVFNALESIKDSSTQIIISNQTSQLETATHIILPGVGAFGDCIKGLKNIDSMVAMLKKQILVDKKPFLGVCVGMQLLANLGLEHGKHPGLRIIPGDVIAIDDQNKKLKVPHMGWNDLEIHQKHPILDGIEDGEHFYFVHSFHFEVENPTHVVASVQYGQQINAILAKDNVIATQFHPEKSSDAGLKILKNFISIPPAKDEVSS